MLSIQTIPFAQSRRRGRRRRRRRLPREVIVVVVVLVVIACGSFYRGGVAVVAAEAAASTTKKNGLQKGCLYDKLSNHNQLRVCNSEDYSYYLDNNNNPDDSNDNSIITDPVERGICRPPEFDYLEIRIKCQDWESVLFGSWVLQILLSEILGVPTTLETGRPDAVMQYYDEEARFQFGTTSNNLQAFRNAVELGNGDCRNIVQNATTSSPEDYIHCAHVIPEVWTARSEQIQQYIRDNILDPPIALGALGIEGWYIPKYTAELDPTLTSWIGLQGERNRHKLAKLFKRPTTWQEYCTNISQTNCTIPDDVAQRPPLEGETNRLHKSGQYTGYFRDTQQSDCSANPTTCTGNIGDFPCGWGGALEATCHWLNIALESNGNEPNSGGWTYGQLSQMWRAANETRNHVMMMWVVPDPTYEEFLGTDFEFVKVTLPAPTQKCQQSKINPEHRCNEDPALRLGTPEGVCDETARPLHKLMLSKLYDLTQGPNIPEAIRNPAYSVISQFALSELQINDMFRYWLLQPDEPREAICQWVIDNLEDLEQFLPVSYPRTIQRIDSSSSSSTARAISIVTSILGAIATLLVIITTILVYRNRERRVLRYAQIEFLYLLLMGSAMVSIGAILTGLQTPPSDASCIVQTWLIGLGYTFQLVPLLVKVAAINRLMQAAQRMRRVKVDRSSLHGGVAAIGLLVTIFLVVWTVVDPPMRMAHYELTDQVLVNGGGGNNDDQATSLFDTTVVQVQFFCSSGSDSWQYVAIAWNFILILCATALAFQSRSVKQHFNEAQVLSRMIYAHFMFVLLRVMAQFFEPTVSVPLLSIVYSLDTIVMLLVYFLKKFLADDHQTGVSGATSTAFFSTSAPSRVSIASGVGDGSPFTSTVNMGSVNSTPFGSSMFGQPPVPPSGGALSPRQASRTPDSEIDSTNFAPILEHKKEVTFGQYKDEEDKFDHVRDTTCVKPPASPPGETQDCNVIRDKVAAAEAQAERSLVGDRTIKDELKDIDGVDILVPPSVSLTSSLFEVSDSQDEAEALPGSQSDDGSLNKQENVSEPNDDNHQAAACGAIPSMTPMSLQGVRPNDQHIGAGGGETSRQDPRLSNTNTDTNVSTLELVACDIGTNGREDFEGEKKER